MNREIKFRGKEVETGVWVEGCLIQRMGYYPGIMSPYSYGGKIRYSETCVTPDTVGQFTGLKDSNGVEIYEGDIIMSNATDGEPIYHEVFYNKEEASFYASLNGKKNAPFGVCGIRRLWIHQFNKVVAGNVYDNPELLKSEKRNSETLSETEK